MYFLPIPGAWRLPVRVSPWVFVVALAGFASRAHGLVVNEIMYHSEDVVDGSLEWIELYNERLDPLDLTDYTICNGVTYSFPSGTWLDGYEYIIVAADPAAFRAKYEAPDVRVLGGWFGSLDNGGERVEICNPGGVTVLEIRYDDRGKWAAAADGTGHTLALVTPYSELDDPDSWRASLERHGTPGAWNGFAAEVTSTPGGANGMDASGFINGWLVLGPYTGWPNCSSGEAILRADWLRGTTTPREEDLEWRDGQIVNTDYDVARSTGLHAAGGARPTLRRYASPQPQIDLNNAVYSGDPSNVMAYGFVYVDNVTGANLPVTIGCGSDDAITVHVNGVETFVNDACRGVGADVQDRFDATLRPGKNLITVKVFENGGGWGYLLRIEERGNGQPITSPSVIQVTTDVDAGLGFDGSGTPIIDPGEDPGGGDDPVLPGDAPIVINEGLLRTTGERWIELYNRTGRSYDLAGHYLTDDPGDLTRVEVAAGVSVAARSRRVFTESELGLDLSVSDQRPRVFLALTDPDGETVIDAVNFEPDHDELSEARLPDGSDELEDAARPTRGTANAIDVNQDIVMNEIMFHPIDEDPSREYIELFHRGAAPVDLTGWKFTNGIDFEFPAGTTMVPGTYLVVARDPVRIREIYGLSEAVVVGPEDVAGVDDFGQLRDGGERVTLQDELGRTVDTVNYRDGGEWSRWADGHGSSLELIDPAADNRRGQAWDASDDSAEAPITEFEYVGRHGGGESELHVLLLDRGITVVDDLSVVGGGVRTDDRFLIDRGDAWRYLKGTSAPPADWNQLGFDDGAWSTGATSIGYGDGDDTTVLDDMQGSYVTIFCRKTFQVPDPAVIDELVLNVLIDDGFVAYLNGQEIASYNVGGRNWDDSSSGTVGDWDDVTRDVSASKGLLRAGTNLLAFQVHNAGAGSSDLTFNPRLIDRTTTFVDGSEQVVNPTFDANTNGWAIEGTHIESGRTTVDPIRGAGSLKIVASGRGDNKVNRIETTNAGLGVLTPGEELRISLKARWVVGARTLLTHGYRHSMARAHDLIVPETLGTPGEINSVTLRQNVVNGGNLGPVFSGFEQRPAVPEAGEDVRVRVRVSDPDGVDEGSLRLWYSLGDPSTNPASRVLSPVGEGLYEAVIPGQALGTKVVFFCTGEDAFGATGRYPADVAARTHALLREPSAAGIHDQRYFLYRHAPRNVATPYHSYRFWLTDRMESELATRRHLSNHLLPGSFIFGGDRIYQEASARFSGSPFARGGFTGSFRVVLPRDDLMHGTIERFTVDDHHGSGTSARERTSHYLLRHQNGGGTKVPYSDLQVLVRWQVNDRNTETIEHVWVPNSEFLSLWFPDDDEGAFFEVDDRFVIDDNGSRVDSTNARLLYPTPSDQSDGNGENKENYRWFFGLRQNNGADDFSELIRVAALMDPSNTSNAAFDARVFDELAVEEMVRYWAIRLNTDDWDQWGASRGKNCYLYRPALDGRWHLLLWDAELTYSNVNSFLIPSDPNSAFRPGGFDEVNRLLSRPRVQRMYYAVLDEMVNGPDAWFGSRHLTPFMDRLAALGMSSTDIGRSGGFIDTRAGLLRDRIRTVVDGAVAFRITTNGGRDFTTDGLEIGLAGDAPVDVASLLVVSDGDEGAAYELAFTSMTSWTASGVVLRPGVNELAVFGIDLRGNVVDTDSITVTSTAVGDPVPSLGAIAPSSAAPGASVHLHGSDFRPGMRVFFGATESPTVEVQSDALARVEVPAGTGSVVVTARNPSSDVSGGLDFSYPPSFVRGDANRDDRVDLSDAVATLIYLFSGGALSCEDAADANDDETLNLTDPIFVLQFLFQGGPAMPLPYPVEGFDPSGAALGCTR